MPKTPYNLKMHDVMHLDDVGWTVMRVPGGWIYTRCDYNFLPAGDYSKKEIHNRNHSIFVPITKQVKEEQMGTLLIP